MRLLFIIALAISTAHADEPCACPAPESAQERVTRLTRELENAKTAARLQAVAVKVNRLNARKAKH